MKWVPDYFYTDEGKVSFHAWKQAKALGANPSKYKMQMTMDELCEQARAVGCLPVVSFVPREAALAIMEPLQMCDDFPWTRS